MNIETAKKINNLLELKEKLLNIAGNYRLYDTHKNILWFKGISKYLDLHMKYWFYRDRQDHKGKFAKDTEYDVIAKELNTKVEIFLRNELNIKIKEIDNQIEQIQC